MKKAVAVLSLFLCGIIFFPASARDWKVRNVTGLRKALESSESGDRILLKGGEYRLTEPLDIKQKEGIYMGPANARKRVEIKGGVEIPRKAWRAGRRGRKLCRIDISNLPVVDFIQKGHGRLNSPSWSEIFADGTIMRLSRWPDEGWMPLDSVVRTGISVRFDGAGYPGDPILQMSSPSADPTISGVAGDEGASRDGSFGIIYFRDEHPLGWACPEMGILSGCFRYGWSDEMVRILSVNADHTLEVRDTTFYGFGVRPGENFQHWCVFNMPEEVNEAGEYALDSERRILYMIPPKSAKRIEISLLEDPLIRISGCREITIEGIRFSCSRGDGIGISGSFGISIDDCDFYNLGERAVTIEADCRNCGLSLCRVYDTGAGGVVLDGGDRRRIIRGDNYVEDCVFHDYNRLEKSMRPGVTMWGLGNRVSGCEFYNSDTQAILMHGNDQLIERCDIHHVCQNVDDCGAIYYGRNPSERGSVIRWNYFHDIIVPRNVRAIYHDDGACACEVYGNVFNRISSPPVQIGGGSDIVYHDNIFMNLDCAAIKTDRRLKTWGKDRLPAHFAYIAQVDGPEFREHYPEFASYLEGDTSEPSRNVLERNVFYNVRWIFEKVEWSSRDYNDSCEGADNFFSRMTDNWKTTENPGFKDIDNPQAGFEADPPLKEHIPAFQTAF